MTSLESSFEILVDTGATHSFTFDPNDFISDIQPVNVSVTGFTGTDATVIGVGIVRLIIPGKNGSSHTVKTEAYYVPPQSSRRLHS
jgi:hypothetical protein